ncbi:MAG: insulinase family protein [Eubacteriales bacterium]
MNYSKLQTYEVLEQRKSEDIQADVVLLQHKKTKARVVLIENEDDNKVFYVGFKTPPKDDTGVAHILEHSVLCGSKNFPLKDPFVELVKGSMNTFLNAMTYPDKTVYPVASCNEKDFQNLMHVYLDAVFYPNMKEEEKIFYQEGWHYHLEEEGDALTINGVVYNEMKGAFSSPDDVMDREVFNSLFPHTEYGKESGGHPDAIPELTYEQFVEFHNQYYHPSNSYLYLYGNMNMVEKLEWIDTHYLSQFEYLSIDSSIAIEETFQSPIETVKNYSITEGESEVDNVYLAHNVVVGNSLDEKLYIAFSVLDYVLCSAPGAPLKQALIERGIGKEVYSVYENGIMQPYYSIVAKGANADQKEEFLAIIQEVLEKIVADGIEQKALQAGIHNLEFKYREADFGSYPKGLIYGLQLLDSWLYHDTKPFIHLEANDTYASLKDSIGTSYYEDLIRKYLLNNQHKSIVTVVPVKGMTTQKEKELEKKLQEYKDSLTKEEITKIIRETEALKEYQETPNTKEDLEKIPLLTREDIKEFHNQVINEESFIEETTYLYHPIFTNEIAYIRLLFDAKQISEELLPYMALLKAILGYVDTKNYTYQELAYETDSHTGGIAPVMNSYVNARELSEYELKFEIKTKVLYPNIQIAFGLMEEIILHSNCQDTKRLYEIIAELRSRMQQSMTSSSHSLAAIYAMAQKSEVAALAERTSSVSYYRFLEDLERNFDQKKEVLVSKLKETMEHLFRPDHLMVDVTATTEVQDEIATYVRDLKGNLYTGDCVKEKLSVSLLQRNVGFMTSAQVQYVCVAGNYMESGLHYTGALRVLRVIMGYEYLWNHVRVKGGAYGCMSSFAKTGDAYFVSYRDPNLTKTLETYEKSVEFLRTFQADERTVMKFIIGAMSDLEVPLTPAARGVKSLGNYLSHVTREDLIREREEILSIDESTIHGMADYVDAFLRTDALCVVGNEEVIRANEELFDTIENLF